MCVRAALAPVLICVCVYVLVQGKEMAEEEDEVSVGMEKGFMDEFFEQVGSFDAPHSSLLLSVFDFAVHLGQAEGIYSSRTEMKPSDELIRLGRICLYIYHHRVCFSGFSLLINLVCFFFPV